MEQTFPIPYIWVPRWLRKEETRKEAGLINRGVVNNSLAQAHSDIIRVVGIPDIGNIAPSNLKLWLKPDPATIFEDAGTNPVEADDTVVQWNDQSGNGNHHTGFGVTLPTYKTNIQNSLPMILGGGSGGLSCSGMDTYTEGNDAAFTFAFAIKKVSNSGSDAIWGSASDDDLDWYFIGTSGSQYLIQKKQGGSAKSKFGGTADTNAHIFTARINGTTCDAWVDDSQIMTAGDIDVTSVTMNNWTLFFMLRSGGVRDFLFDGYIGEVSFWNAALSSGDITSVNTALMTRWGL